MITPLPFANIFTFNPLGLMSVSGVLKPADFIIKKPTNRDSNYCKFSSKDGVQGLPSGQKLKSFADIDTRNRDVTLSFLLSGNNNFDQNNLFVYIKANGQVFPTRPLDQGGQWTASKIKREPGLYMDKMDAGFEVDSESGAVLDIHVDRYLTGLAKDGVNLKSRPDLSPANAYPFYYRLLKKSGGNYMLAIDLSKGSEALGSDNGKVKVRLDQVYPKGTVSMDLEFVLKNGKWVSVTCLK